MSVLKLVIIPDCLNSRWLRINRIVIVMLFNFFNLFIYVAAWLLLLPLLPPLLSPLLVVDDDDDDDDGDVIYTHLDGV